MGVRGEIIELKKGERFKDTRNLDKRRKNDVYCRQRKRAKIDRRGENVMTIATKLNTERYTEWYEIF